MTEKNLTESFLKLSSIIFQRETRQMSSDIALKCIHLFYNANEYQSFDNCFKFFNDNKYFTETSRLDAAIEYIEEMLSTTNQLKIFYKVNLPIVLFVANLAIEEEISKEDFSSKTEEFFEILKKDSVFAKHSTFSAMAAKNVNKRIEIFADYVGTFYHNDNKEKLSSDEFYQLRGILQEKLANQDWDYAIEIITKIKLLKNNI